ncbi:formyltetrahydrofolate deformylase [bacterium]
MNKKNTVILLLSCLDQKGIVAKISQFIFENNGNIINSNQHSDTINNYFFMRIEWELDKFRIEQDKIADAFSPIAGEYNMQWNIYFSEKHFDTAIFVSKYDHCLLDLLFRQRAGELDVHIKLIISNHEDLKSIADDFSIPFHYLPKTKENKLEQEKKEIELLQKNNINFIVLARYMQILGKDFVNNFKSQIINIHHSFLPAFIGQNPYGKAFDRGVKIIGATSHYVTENLDEGPIIEQDVIRVSHKDTVDDMVRKGRDLERLVLANAVKAHLEHRILSYGRKTIVFE